MNSIPPDTEGCWISHILAEPTVNAAGDNLSWSDLKTQCIRYFCRPMRGRCESEIHANHHIHPYNQDANVEWHSQRPANFLIRNWLPVCDL